MAIDPKLVSIKEAKDLPTADAKSTSEFIFFEDQVLKKSPMSNIYDKVTSGIKGVATQTNAPTVYTVEAYPDGLIETYRAVEPLNNTSAWYTLADATNKAKFPITQEILNANDVLLTSTNGVVSVFLNAKPLPYYNTEELSPTSTDKAETGKSISEYVDNTLIENNILKSGNVLTTQINATGFSKYGGPILDSRTKEAWFTGISTKTFNRISLPITGDFAGTGLSDSIYVKVAKNGTFIFSDEITLADLSTQNIDTTSNEEADMMFNVDIPSTIINSGDIIYVGLMTKSASDLLGFVYATDRVNELGVNNGVLLYNDSDITAYSSAPAKPAENGYSLYAKFYNYGTVLVKNPAFFDYSTRDTNTFIGGFNTVIDALLTAKPTAKILFVTHHTEDGTQGNGYLKPLIQQQVGIANYWGSPVLNLSQKLGWVKKTGSKNTLQTHVTDEIHPASSLDSILSIKRYVKEFLTPTFDSWSGKKVAWYGTSIPYGHPVNEPSYQYPNLAVGDLGGTILNKSWPGSVIRRNKVDGTPMDLSFLDATQPRNYQQDMVALIGTANEPDLFVFDFGINDITFEPTDFI